METNQANESKKEQVREMFDSIAPRYDFLNHLLSLGIDRRWRKKMVRMVRAAHPHAILDVATGTGDFAIMMARRISGAEITGVDLSAEMLHVGRGKVARKLKGRELKMIEGDAEALPFGDEAFDAVTAVFGVRNFGNLRKGIEEMHRVLNPGGGIYIMEFSMPPKRNLWGMLYRFYFRNVLPWIGRIVSGDKRAYTYLPESVGEFPYGERFEALLREVGFGEVSGRPLMGGVVTIYKGMKVCVES